MSAEDVVCYKPLKMNLIVFDSDIVGVEAVPPILVHFSVKKLGRPGSIQLLVSGITILKMRRL